MEQKFYKSDFPRMCACVCLVGCVHVHLCMLSRMCTCACVYASAKLACSENKALLI